MTEDVEEFCPVRIYDGRRVFGRICRPVKSDGLCGIHARAKRRRELRKEQGR